MCAKRQEPASMWSGSTEVGAWMTSGASLWNAA